ncbi:TIGR03085 family metal-binding protein [Nocardioides solisilvae]|uniref:TIGR03085 family metal-binding protein n=1 Tax=Nocardioides solisilvae TaxID=1542435 RepID=UPI000D744E2E|nr:TIGR03085 family metal-binding protein [Nocardioides solisilvae]
MTDSLARRERAALCDTALALGPDAPTCCEGWDTGDLVAHLLVRERSATGIGQVVPPLHGLVERAMARHRSRPLSESVTTLRTPPPWLPGPLDRAMNTVELFVHHEDLRRARPGWAPRELAAADESTLWSQLRLAGLALVRPAGVPVVAATGDGRRAVLRRGAEPVVLTGRPSELLLLLFGRPTRDVAVDGPEELVRRFRAAFDGA